MSEAPKRATANASATVVPEPTPAAAPASSAAEEQIATLQAALEDALKEKTVEEEVVARQAGASADLSSLQPATPVAEPEVAVVAEPVAVPTPAPVQDDRQTALTAPHSAAKLFTSGQAAIEDAERCADDLRNLTSQAVVYFPSGGVTEVDGGIEQARLIGQVAQSCRGVQIRVEGHSDASGDPAANQRLSEQRAQSVIQRIAASGVDTSMFFAEGVGSRTPSDVIGPEPRAFYDRRVEFSVVDDVTRVSARAPGATQLWANETCVVDLERAALNTTLFYAPRSVSLPGQDLETAIDIAVLASACPHARLRIVGHHSGDVQDREDVSTGLLRAKALMALMIGRGIPSDQIIISAPSRALSDAGLPGGRVNFDVVLDE
ncbi:OmpA family protein [Tateyamaria sp.]|uniref:OmpA family protein n=1 Tax=Tateyamaria sp. TaxID=1929288 RepID=UPI00329AA59A